MVDTNQKQETEFAGWSHELDAPRRVGPRCRGTEQAQVR
jgi:hypothetical protein